MPTQVDYSDRFTRNLRRLARKYPSLADDVDGLITELELDYRPGDRMRRVGRNVYKVRLPNRSARRGKSGGFRVIYQDRDGILVLLLLIYSKTERSNIPDEAIRRVISEFE